MLQQSNVFNFVKEYESFSPHRTGGVGNGNVLSWLKNYLSPLVGISAVTSLIINIIIAF